MTDLGQFEAWWSRRLRWRAFWWGFCHPFASKYQRKRHAADLFRDWRDR